jgi:glycosyltransferase involved in cell wall biosynthesis
MYNGYSFVAQKCVRVVFRIPHRVIVLSQYWKAFLSALMNPRRVNIIGNPIDCAKFETSSDRQKSDKGHKILLLGVVGKHKGHYDALKALPIVLKHFPNATMIFAGKADAPGETEHLQKLAQESGIATHVRFLGLVTGDAKINLLQNCSVMVLPSYGENMPLSIMEGMAAKLPVVASSVGAIPELLENGKLGILIEPGNHVTLADAIKRLLANPRLTRLMALAAYKKVKNLYDTKIIAKQIDRLYQAVMAE